MSTLHPTYTVRSEGGGLTAPGSESKAEAMRQAVELAATNPGQRILLLKRGAWVKGHAWTDGPRAEVQR